MACQYFSGADSTSCWSWTITAAWRVLSLEDVVETLIGIEIVDEADNDVDMRKLAREKWESRRADLNALRAQPPGTPISNMKFASYFPR